MKVRITLGLAVAAALAGCSSKSSEPAPAADAPAVAPATTGADATGASAPAPAAPAPAAPASAPDTFAMPAETRSTPSGLKYAIEAEGSGAKPEHGQTVAVHYTGWLTDGTRFDSSRDAGEPIEFPLGTGQVIKGWDEGIALLKVGGKATLVIPPELGYGDRGAGGVIPPNATLVFKVELVNAR